MLRLFALSLVLAFTAAAHAQPTGMPEWFDPSKTDENGQPAFSAAPIADTTMADFAVVANYYTIEGNIDEPSSAVFMDEAPSLDDYDRFARSLPSYAFVVVAEEEVRSIISLWQEPADDSFWFLVTDPETGEAAFVPAGYAFASDAPVLTEVRGAELIQRGVDTEAGAVEGEGGQVQVVFNQTRHNVLPFELVLSDVVALVQENDLYQ